MEATYLFNLIGTRILPKVMEILIMLDESCTFERIFILWHIQY